METPNTARLRARLFTVLSAGVLYPVLVHKSPADADTAETPPDTLCLPWDEADGACPSAEDAAASLDPGPYCSLVSVDGEGSFGDASCCYPVTVDCSTDTDPGYDGDYNKDCGCYGRPFVREGAIIQAEAVRSAAWSQGPQTEPGALDPRRRQVLQAAWTRNALSEHSSAAGFSRFVLDLMAHGAPAELVMRAQIAALEETGHARRCFALASAYAGEPVGPGRLPLGEQAPVARDLVELAVWTAREGAIGETLAALLAAELAAAATEPAVQDTLRVIAEEEARHAELAWATLRWALQTGGAPVRDALAQIFRESPPRASEQGIPEDPVLAAHGVLHDGAVAAVLRAGWARVVQPAAAALLGAGGVSAQPRSRQASA